MPASALTPNDARSIVRLLGDVCCHSGDHSEKKRLLLDGICRLVEADAWVWGLFVQLSPDKFPSYVLQVHGGFDDDHAAKFLVALGHPDNAIVMAPFARLLKEKGCHITQFRQQSGLEEIYQGSALQAAWQAAGVEPGILSCRPLDPVTLSTIGIYRRPDAPAFTQRESRIAHILLSEVPWLHQEGWSVQRDSGVAELSRRLCTVLNLLILGRPRREIAAKLRISLHTTNDYVKEVFRFFGVHSQSALIARFRQGNGGDLPYPKTSAH